MNEIILAIIAALSGGGIAGLLSVIQRRSLVQSQANKLYAEAESIKIKSLTEALEALRADYNRLSQEGEELKLEIEKLRKEQNKLRRAIEKIKDCTYNTNCPVTNELQKVINK